MRQTSAVVSESPMQVLIVHCNTLDFGSLRFEVTFFRWSIIFFFKLSRKIQKLQKQISIAKISENKVIVISTHD